MVQTWLTVKLETSWYGLLSLVSWGLLDQLIKTSRRVNSVTRCCCLRPKCTHCWFLRVKRRVSGKPPPNPEFVADFGLGRKRWLLWAMVAFFGENVANCEVAIIWLHYSVLIVQLTSITIVPKKNEEKN